MNGYLKKYYDLKFHSFFILCRNIMDFKKITGSEQKDPQN